MKACKIRSIATIFAEGKPIDAALRKAAKEALLKHKQAGLPLVIWRDGKIAHIPPGKIRTTTKSPARKKAS